jgi:hypothetical protein
MAHKTEQTAMPLAVESIGLDEIAPRHIGKDASINADDFALISMGKKPRMTRRYNFWTCEFHHLQQNI